jgi:glycerol dehydrogenase
MNSSPYIFISPSKYVQGAGAVFSIGEHVGRLGNSAFVIGGASGLAATREGREISFRERGIRQTEALFGGESSDGEISRLSELARGEMCDVIVASGGGKAIDAAKAVSVDLRLPSVIVPTVASSDSPCSALAVIYDGDGSFNRVQSLGRNPDVVLVDTAIIARAPVRQLVSGMGDALATWYEADACIRAGAQNPAGGRVTLAAAALARLCRDAIFENGRYAVSACRCGVVTPALERVVEANTLLSGLGFESAGVAVAHAISEGLSALPEFHGASHGEKVAFGLLTQLVLEGKQSDEVDRVILFFRDVGLPATLFDLGAGDVDRPKLMTVARIAAEPGRPSQGLSFPVSADALFDAIIAADAVGRESACARV